MENTGQVLFRDDTPQWYIAFGDRWVGPLPASEVYAKVTRQEISWAHYVWRQGQKEWTRLCDTPAFQVAVPSAPAKTVQSEVKKLASSKSPPPFTVAAGASGGAEDAEEGKIWFVYYNNTQFGPFAAREVKRSIESGKLNARVHAWCDGMAGWERIEKIGELAPSTRGKASAPDKAASKSGIRENRRAPRVPMVAKIMLANDDTVIVGVCRDVSVGGMQVLTERVPGLVGQTIRLNVSPPTESKSAAKAEFEPFVAEGVIVRLLEDGRGFSFRFEKLPERSKRAIEKYLVSTSG